MRESRTKQPHRKLEASPDRSPRRDDRSFAHPVVAPRRPPGSELGLSNLAAGYRTAEPYLAASSTLVATVITFTALGYWCDRWLKHPVQWMLLIGAVVGIGIGFMNFFRKILRAGGSP